MENVPAHLHECPLCQRVCDQCDNEPKRVCLKCYTPVCQSKQCLESHTCCRKKLDIAELLLHIIYYHIDEVSKFNLLEQLYSEHNTQRVDVIELLQQLVEQVLNGINRYEGKECSACNSNGCRQRRCFFKIERERIYLGVICTSCEEQQKQPQWNWVLEQPLRSKLQVRKIGDSVYRIPITIA